MLSPTTCGAPPAAIHSLCAGGTISFGLRSCPSKLASTTGRIEFTWWPHDGHGVTAWSFSSRCSPPGVVAPMQLRSDTGLPVSARSGTLTLLSKSALRRTRADFQPAGSGGILPQVSGRMTQSKTSGSLLEQVGDFFTQFFAVQTPLILTELVHPGV